MPPSKKPNLFEEVFLGEYVEILIDLTMSKVVESEDGQTIHEAQTIVRGIVLGVDDNFCYLGHTSADGITHSVSIGHIILVTITSAESESVRDILGEVPDDYNPEDVN